MVDSVSSSMGRIIVDDRGRASLSGLGGQYDFADTVDQLMAARRLPVDRMEGQVEKNLELIAAYEDLRGLVGNLDRALAGLRGTPSFDKAGDAFAAKQAYLTGAGGQASALVGVNVSNSAALGDNSFEVLRTARAQRIAADGQASRTEPLGLSGSFELNGQTITIGAGDSLSDIRDRFNAANSGENATGVSASIISAGEGDHVLILTGADAATEMEFAGEAGILESLGILEGGAIKNEIQAAQTARLKVEGLTDAGRWESARLASGTATLGETGTLTINGTTVEVQAADSLEDLATAINDIDGVTASLMEDQGQVRLVIEGEGDRAVEITGSESLISGLGLNNERIIERESNTVDDLFAGVTLNLYAAAEGETITLEVEQNLDAVKESVIGFVEAYNELKQFINSQKLPVEDENADVTAESGPLLGSSVLRDVEQQLSRLIGSNVPGSSETMAVLAQLGVELVDNNEIRDPLLQSNLVIDEAKLNESLLNNPGDVKKLLAFDFQSSDPRVTMLGFGPKVQYDADGYSLDVEVEDGKIVSAMINGIEGSVTVSGQNLTVTGAVEGLEGLRLFYAGDSSASDIRIDVSPGIATQMSFATEKALAENSGAIDVEVANLTRNNDQLDERIERALDRLEIQRQSLSAQFLATEQALARMQNLQERITQMIEAQFNNSN